MPLDHDVLVNLTADIASAHVSNNSVSVGDVGPMIERIFSSLQALGAPVADRVSVKPKGAVGVRASLKPQHLVSMIDGKPYKMLKRHLSTNGYTPETYREAFNLPRDYPIVAPEYAEMRRALAKRIGLGRKAKVVEAAKPVRKPRARKPVASGVKSTADNAQTDT